MDWITYSWLACCATAPSIAAIAVWVLFIFHTYRRRWKTVDIFLLTIALQEIPSTLCAFGYAVVTVIRTRSESSCSLIIWGLTTTRVFQLTTLTSLAFDRALTLKWPYKYRFSVRHSQIRYHIVVLCVISALVGIAGLFARLQYQDYQYHFISYNYTNNNLNQSTNYICTLNPYSWDHRYNIFISALYSFLTFVTFVCALYIETHRFRGNSRPNSRISSVGNLVSDHLGSTEAIGRSESCRTLYAFQSSKQGSINKKTLDDQKTFDLRWATVIGSLVLCYAVNHGPYLAFMLGGLSVPFWNPMHDNIVVWLGIVEGLLMPIALYITDDPFRDSVKRSFKRRNYRCSDVSKSSDGSFPLYFNDFAMIDKKPYLMSSIPTGVTGSHLTLISNYRRSFNENSKIRRTNINPLMPPATNTYLNSMKKGKSQRNNSNDKYMFLSIYGVDKVIPVNKQSTAIITDGNITQCVNPYYKNSTSISTITSSENSMKKDKSQTIQRNNSIEKNFPWFQANNPLGHHQIEDMSWQSHHHELTNCVENKEKLHEDDEHIYATLSETFSVRSTLPDKRQLKDSKIETRPSNGQSSSGSICKNGSKSGAPSVDGFSISGVSFTTTANDDFEYSPGDEACFNTIVSSVNNNNNNNKDNDNNDKSNNVDNRYGSINRDNNVCCLSSGSYSPECGSKKHIYDNLAFQFENIHSSTMGHCDLADVSLTTHQPSLSSISSLNYLRRYSPFVSNPNNVSYYKRRGRQSFSASDIHKLDLPLYPLNQHNLAIKFEKTNTNYRSESARLSSSPRKTLSETNLLLSSKKSGSLTKITENTSLNSTNGEHEDTLSDDSLYSNSTTSSWDIYGKITEALKNKSKQNSIELRQNIYMSRPKGIRSKKLKAKRKKKQVYNSEKELHSNQQYNQGNTKKSQSIWNSNQNNRVGVNLKGINRIGSYAQDWHVNKSMPDLSSFTTCPSPIFSPLYRKESKVLPSTNND